MKIDWRILVDTWNDFLLCSFYFFSMKLGSCIKCLKTDSLVTFRVVGFSLELKLKFTSFFEMKYVKNGNLTIHSSSFTSLTVFHCF